MKNGEMNAFKKGFSREFVRALKGLAETKAVVVGDN